MDENELTQQVEKLIELSGPKEYTPEELVETSLFRTQVTANHETNKEPKSWTINRDECDAGESLDERCNLVAASLGKGVLDIVAKRLICGCLLISEDDLETMNWDIGSDAK